MKQYLTRFEVSEMLNLSLPTLNKYNKTGILPAYKIGHKVYYKLTDIENSMIHLGGLTNKQEL